MNMSSTRGNNSWSMLGKLKTAVKKVKFLLSLNLNRWRIASMLGVSASQRRLSFNSDRPSLMNVNNNAYYHESSPPSLHRTISYSSEDDIDKRAELFIANFHKQLQIERQISLQLRYSNSISSSSP